MKAKRRKKIGALVEFYCKCHEVLGVGGKARPDIKLDPSLWVWKAVVELRRKLCAEEPRLAREGKSDYFLTPGLPNTQL